MVREAIDQAKREARPDGRREIKGHPRNLVLPMSKIMRHDPASARVTEALERIQALAPSCAVFVPSVQVHWYVDGHEKGQIAGDADDSNDEAHANDASELRQQPAEGNPNQQESYCPYGILYGIRQIVGRQHSIP